jgi:2-polyprenyl-3-methyl-5-hydroxy-6-metoxy-1,4-benzoquinol methylase
MPVDPKIRVQHEIEHGRRLASDESAELAWGWSTRAGALRVEQRSSLVLQGADLKPGMRVMEIGCGTGLFTSIYSRSGADITAIELVPELLEKARSRKIANATFIAGRFEDYPGEAVFDAVIGNSILHHLEVEVALRRIYQLLKPGARMSFAEPNMMNPQVFLERQFYYLPIFSNTSPDETAFIRWRLRALLRRIGYEDIRIRLFDWLHPHTPAAIVPAVKRMSNFLERVPLIREISGCMAVSARRPS